MVHQIVATAFIGASLWANTSAFSAVVRAPNNSVVSTTSCLRSTNNSNNSDEKSAIITPSSDNNNRRSVLLQTASVASSFLFAATANAAIDPALLKALPVEGDTTGAASRLRMIESANGPQPDDSKDIAFTKLPSGASYRQYREGKGDATVGPGSKVAIETTIRCSSFPTRDEPGGVKYFTTKGDTEFNELAWTVGSGEFPPELEECMMGMKKGGVRRCELPSTVVFAAKKNDQLPLPSEKNKDGKRMFEQRLFKTDATLLFEVLVTRIK